MLTTVNIAVQVLRIAAIAEARQAGLKRYVRPDRPVIASINSPTTGKRFLNDRRDERCSEGCPT